MDLKKITAGVCGLVVRTGNFLKEEIGKLKESDVELKSVNNYVTYVDKAAERMLVENLSEFLPGTGFIAEENPSLPTRELNWVIDPLDGTTNFIHGVPLYCISIGLLEGTEVILGVVYEVNLGECFSTWKGSPSFLNGKEIRVSGSGKLSDSLFATGFPYYDYSRLDAYLNLFRYFIRHSRGVRRLGSAAADLAYVACGRFDGFFEYGLSPWDVAAGSLLVQNAGGSVCDFSSGGNYLFGKEIIATNRTVHKDFMKAFRENFI
jgi:myo-inositol-1(or 4)-monophosphatase